MTLVKGSLGPRRWGRERETSLPSSASWSPLHNSPVTTQAEAEVSGHTGPEVRPVLDPRRSRGWYPDNLSCETLARPRPPHWASIFTEEG